MPISSQPMSQSLLQLIREAFGDDGTELHDHVVLQDLEAWDSLNHMVFITKIESEFSIVLNGDDIADMRSIGGIREILRMNYDVDA